MKTNYAKHVAKMTNWKQVSWNSIYDFFSAEIERGVEDDFFLTRLEDSHVFYRLPPTARNALVVISGTHGVEGPAGSFVQAMILREEPFREFEDTAIFLIHALNTWGYKNGRRVDENNVDVNRNMGTEFVTRTAYAEIHHLILPKVWNDEAIEQFHPQMLPMVFGGQCDFPDGIFYGGREPSRSAEKIRDVCTLMLDGFEKISVLDIHTGLGKFGKVMLISPATSLESPLARRTNLWTGGKADFFNFYSGLSIVPSRFEGHVLEAVTRWLPDAEVTPLALEFGTCPLIESFPWFVAENWIHHNPGQLPPGKEREIREKFWDIFYPQDNREKWLKSIWKQSSEIIRQVIHGMNA